MNKKVHLAKAIFGVALLSFGTKVVNADTLSGTFSLNYSSSTKAHVVAYVTTPENKHVRTLVYWGKSADGFWSQVKNWNTLTSVKVVNYSIVQRVKGVDAISKASVTISPALVGAFSWNGKDSNNAAVPAGNYVLNLESSQWNNRYTFLKVPFEFDGKNKIISRTDTTVTAAKNITATWSKVSFNVTGTNTTPTNLITPNVSKRILSLGGSEISFPENIVGKSTLSIFTPNGKELLNTIVDIHPGSHTLDLEGMAVSKGNFIVKIIRGDYSQTSKISVK